MNERHREFFSIGLTLGIILLTIFIVHRFIPSLAWAAIIVIATYPLYQRWRAFFGKYKNLSAFLFTFFLALMFLLPLSWLFGVLIKESQIFLSYLQQVNRTGGVAPDFLKSFPIFSQEMTRYWDAHMGQPGNIKRLFSEFHLSLTPLSYYAKQIGSNLAHRGVQFGFTLLTLFFFYRDGDSLLEDINHVGVYCLGKRWYLYATGLPSALRATVNGTVIVGLGVGVLTGISYFLAGFPAPTLTGFVTALAAMIPFLAPLVFFVVASVLFSSGAMWAAVFVLIWGSLVLFVADHFIKPVLIGGAIKLPFLAVLFGILGGMETLGLLGLFVGPLIMVLFVTLWKEPEGYLSPVVAVK